MAAAAKKPADDKSPAGANKPGFGLKLRAWWEGVDVDALLARQAQAADVPAAPKQAAPPKVAAPVNIAVPFDPWGPDCADTAQLIWGKGFTGPGGPEHVISMSKLLALTPEMSMAELGAGLGGAARVLAEHFGVWVTGFETSSYLVTAGNELSFMAGLARKAMIQPLDMSLHEPFERRFDRIYGHGFLSKMEQVGDIVEKIAMALKPDGLLLVTDFFAADAAARTDHDVVDWLASEPHAPYLHTGAQALEEFEKHGLKVRVNEPITDQHSKLVTAAWKQADRIVAELMADEATAGQVPALLKEAEIWTRRLKMFSSGKVEVRRLLCVRNA